MQLTRASDYAVRVMIHLAGLPPGSRVSREVLAEAGDIPAHFLSKIMQTLARAGLIVSHRGVTGGFSLARPAGELTMLEVVEAVQGPIWLNQCVNPGQPCRRQGWCAAHRLWVEAQDAVIRVLRSATLEDLARESAERGSDTEVRPCALGEELRWS